MKIMPTGMARRRRRYGVVLFVIVAIGVDACGGSAGSAAKAVGRDGVSQIATDEDVVLVPRVLGGEAGWCMARPRALFGPGACAEAPGAGPIVAEYWSSTGSSESAVASGVAITTSAVASVSVEGGEPIPTRSEPGLPGSLRTVSVEERVSARGKKFVEFMLPMTRRRFTPLDSHGGTIGEVGDQPVLSFKVPAVSWIPPETEPAGLCKIDAPSVGILSAVGGSVATRATSASDVPGEPLLSCISVRYRGGGSPLIASVLISAHRPGATAGPLPNAQPVRRRPGLYRALGASGAMVARRIPGAWLAVSGGDSQDQRVVLLTRLHATLGV